MRHPDHVLQFVAVAAALILGACGTAPTGSAAPDGDAAGGDTTVSDTAGGDTAISDTAGGDTAVSDTAGSDSQVTDVGDADSGSSDVSAAETGGGDAPDASASADVDAQPSDAAPGDATPGDAAADIASANITGKVVEAGWSFGECLKACKGTMTLQGASLQLTISDNDGTPAHMAKGVLTTGAAAALDDLMNPLVGKPLALVTGCPDCADGGAAYVVFSDGVTTSKHSYPYGKPPAALAAIDKLLAAAMAGLKTCKGDETVVVLGTCPLDLP